MGIFKSCNNQNIPLQVYWLLLIMVMWIFILKLMFAGFVWLFIWDYFVYLGFLIWDYLFRGCCCLHNTFNDPPLLWLLSILSSYLWYCVAWSFDFNCEFSFYIIFDTYFHFNFTLCFNVVFLVDLFISQSGNWGSLLLLFGGNIEAIYCSLLDVIPLVWPPTQ